MADTEEIIEEKELTKKEKKALAKQEAKNAKENGKKKKGGFIKFVLFFLVILGAIYALLYFDVFGVRSKYLDATIQNTPVLQKIFPQTSETAKYTTSDYVNEINTLKAENEQLASQVEDLKAQNEAYVEQIGRLSPLEEEQVKFKEEKLRFDQMIAENDPNAYKTFYESIYPDTAKEEYNKIIGNQATNKEVSDYVARFTAMDESNAASILEIMANTDIDLVVQILNNMSADKSGAVLGAMTPESAAVVAKRMAPTTY